MNITLLRTLAAQKPGTPGRKRADAWLWSWAQDRWAHDQLKLLTFDGSELIGHMGILVPNETGHLMRADNSHLAQWAMDYIGARNQVKPRWRKIIMPGQLMRPSDFFLAFGLKPMPEDFLK